MIVSLMSCIFYQDEDDSTLLMIVSLVSCMFYQDEDDSTLLMIVSLMSCIFSQDDDDSTLLSSNEKQSPLYRNMPPVHEARAQATPMISHSGVSVPVSAARRGNSPWSYDLADKRLSGGEIGWGRASNTYWEGLSNASASNLPPLNKNNSSSSSTVTSEPPFESKAVGLSKADTTKCSNVEAGTRSETLGWESELFPTHDSASWGDKSAAVSRPNTSSISSEWTPFNSQQIVVARAAGDSYASSISTESTQQSRIAGNAVNTVTGASSYKHSTTPSSSTQPGWSHINGVSSEKSFAETFHLASPSSSDSAPESLRIVQSFIPHVVQNQLINQSKQSAADTRPRAAIPITSKEHSLTTRGECVGDVTDVNDSECTRTGSSLVDYSNASRSSLHCIDESVSLVQDEAKVDGTSVL